MENTDNGDDSDSDDDDDDGDDGHGGGGGEEEGNINGKATLGNLYNVHNNNGSVSWRQNIFDMKEFSSYFGPEYQGMNFTHYSDYLL